MSCSPFVFYQHINALPFKIYPNRPHIFIPPPLPLIFPTRQQLTINGRQWPSFDIIDVIGLIVHATTRKRPPQALSVISVAAAERTMRCTLSRSCSYHFYQPCSTEILACIAALIFLVFYPF